MIGFNIFRKIKSPRNQRATLSAKSFASGCNMARRGVLAMIMALFFVGFAEVADASEVHSPKLYVRVGDVDTYVPIDLLKDKTKPQITDIISSVVEKAVNNADVLSPDQINQAVILAGSDVCADIIARRVQTIYAQAESTGVDIVTLVMLDNVFAADELAIYKASKGTDYGVVNGSHGKKSLVIGMN